MKTKQIFSAFLIGLCVPIFLLNCSNYKKTNPYRLIDGNNLISTKFLKKTFNVSEHLQFLTDSAFVLKERSNTEVFLFTDSKVGETNRFLQFQFENLKPEIEGTYKFHDLTDSLQISDLHLLQSHWCFDLVEVAEKRPKSDIAIVQKMFNNKGVTTTGTYVGKRYIYLSKDRRFEMLIIYGEKSDFRGIDCNDEETAVPLLQKMDEQILKLFYIQNN